MVAPILFLVVFLGMLLGTLHALLGLLWCWLRQDRGQSVPMGVAQAIDSVCTKADSLIMWL